MKEMRVTITFKESERYIYEEILKHSCKASYIKDVLAREIKIKASDTENSAIKNFFE